MKASTPWLILPILVHHLLDGTIFPANLNTLTHRELYFTLISMDSNSCARGNNVVTFKGDQSSTTQQTSDGLVFDYTPDASLDPTEQQNLDFARTNTFYIVNSLHDTAYKYGFTENAFNFQSNNFDNGGRQNDRITVSVQDGAGTNNANFATPPE